MRQNNIIQVKERRGGGGGGKEQGREVRTVVTDEAGEKGGRDRGRRSNYRLSNGALGDSPPAIPLAHHVAPRSSSPTSATGLPDG